MTPEELVSEAVYKAMSETFEGMAFVQLSRQEGKTPFTGNPDQIWARVDVKKPMEGFLLVAYSQETGAQIVESLYGMMDDSGSSEIMLDALREIVNTVVGRCMSFLVPEGQTFELGLPETGEGWPEIGEAAIFAYDTMDGGQLLAAAEMEALEGSPIRETESEQEPPVTSGWG